MILVPLIDLKFLNELQQPLQELQIGGTSGVYPGLDDEPNKQEREMSVDGSWNLTMETPMGERTATLDVTSAGGALTGTQSADGNSAEIFDGTVNGSDVAWKVSITTPMPMTLEYTATVDGDGMSGQMQIGVFGSFPFSGTRA
jgi:hypothetical protein